MQQANLLPIQNGSAVTEQLKIIQNINECAITESLLSVREDSNILLNKEENCRRQTEEQTVIDNHVKKKPMSVSTSVHKKSPGRPKKTEVI